MDQPSPESGGRGEMRDTRVIDYVIAKKSRCFSTFVHMCNLIYVSAHKEIYGLGSQSNNISVASINQGKKQGIKPVLVKSRQQSCKNWWQRKTMAQVISKF